MKLWCMLCYGEWEYNGMLYVRYFNVMVWKVNVIYGIRLNWYFIVLGML